MLIFAVRSLAKLPPLIYWSVIFAVVARHDSSRSPSRPVYHAYSCAPSLCEVYIRPASRGLFFCYFSPRARILEVINVGMLAIVSASLLSTPLHWNGSIEHKPPMEPKPEFDVVLVYLALGCPRLLTRTDQSRINHPLSRSRSFTLCYIHV